VNGHPGQTAVSGRPLALLGPFFRQHRYQLATGFAALLGVDALQLCVPRLLKRGVDLLAVGRGSARDLLLVSLAILAIGIGVTVLRFVWRTRIIGFSRRLEHGLRIRLIHHILGLDRPFFDRHSTGDIMAHAANDLSAVQMACGMGMVAAVDALVMSLAAITFMLLIDVRLTLIALAPMPLLALCARMLTRRLHRNFDKVQAQFSLLTEFARTTLVSIRLIKAYTQEALQKGSFDRLGREYVRRNLGVAVIQGLLFPVATMVGNTGMLLVLLFGGRLVISGTISMGDFVAFVTYLHMLVWPMMAVGWVANLAQRGLTSLGRIRLLLAARPVLENSATEEPPKQPRPVFHCQGLSFTYRETSHPALEQVDLRLYPGITGLTGPTGSGKSTLCKLLTRQYPVDPGMLFLDGRDVNQLPLHWVRRQIAYVSQDPVLLSWTIGENIRLGAPEATDAEVEEAARLAALHEDILQFPEGYDTRLGERGVNLSGGQKQRLALARALVCRRPILILDDGLSALDVETEEEIFRNLRARLEGRTVLLVSHRLKVLQLAASIVILEQGRVTDRGQHGELLARNAFYRAVARRQGLLQ